MRSSRPRAAMIGIVTAGFVWALASSAAPSLGRPFVPLVDAIIRQGPEGLIPPHLSVVLGISAVEHATPVKQAVVRNGREIRVFSVSEVNPGDLVILTHNDQNQSTKAYALSASGRLRKAVFFVGTEPAEERPPAEARADFAAESKFWKEFSARLAPSK